MKNQFIAITLAIVVHFSLTAMAQPVTTTLAATGITSTNATLNGSVNPNGAVTSAYFQFGLTTNYDSESTFIEFPATNVTLAMPGVMAASLPGAAGTNWIQTGAPYAYWNGIASSADGTRLAAAATQGGGIYTSTNGGISWEANTNAPAELAWQGIASSADGIRLAAVVNDSGSGGIFTSTNGGATWTGSSVGPDQWYAIASSADGTRLAAVLNSGNPGGIYTSTNGGATWTQTGMLIQGNWQSIASSADGTRLAVAAANGANICTSTNGGVTWTVTSAPSAGWNGIASSADGLRLTAVNYDLGSIYISADGGNTWAQSGAPGQAWQSVASSADGRRLTAGTYNNSIWTSLDSGATWTEGNAPAGTWTAIASSADGSHLAAVAYGGALDTSTGPMNPLSAGTTYHYRIVGVNITGTSDGNDLAFTTTGTGTPTVTTLPASGNPGTNAILNGSLLTAGLNTTMYFQYGLTTNYGSYSATNMAAATNVLLSVSNLVKNLTAGVTYHFQLVASNSAGTSVGGDVSFVTPILAPTVTTLPATGITSDSATLNGLINPNGATTLAYFQYGLTTNYGGFSTLNTVAVTNGNFSLADVISNWPPGIIWAQTSLPNDNWISLASSADGTHLAAASYVQGGASGLIYTSTNSGSTWTPTSAPSSMWEAIASSADGSHLAAVIYGGGIYTSTDGGVNWAATSASSLLWDRISSSTDGTYLAATIFSGGIYTSTNSGGTWVESTAPSEYWGSIASSANGLRLAATVNGTGIFTSTNAGTDWTLTSAPTTRWQSIASSADGLHLSAVMYQGGIYTSTNGGTTWTDQTNAPNSDWYSIAASADGTRLAAADNQIGIYISTNSGATWTQTAASGANWVSIASSSDGTALAAVAAGGGGYTSVKPLILTPGTTYHYRAVGVNSVGTNYGNDLTFTTLSPKPPAVTNLPASSITITNATLNGLVNPDGLATTVYFQYGLTASYGSYSATNLLTATYNSSSVSNLISGLTPGTTYHFRLVASNSAGVSQAGDLTFTTPVPPTVTTLPATSITSTNATLNGSANPNGAATSAYFQYGLTTSYGYQGILTGFPATNTTLNLPGLVLTSLASPAGMNWTQTSASSDDWYSIASSADGLHLAAVSYLLSGTASGDIFTSINGGVTWTATTAPASQWQSIASSADGTHLAAAVYGGGIYTSANGGTNWTPTGASNANWYFIASSADGSHLAAVVYGGGIYTSVNGGTAWTFTGASNLNWASIASSSDGSHLAAVVQGGGIYTSANGGTNWTAASAPGAAWNWIASSADGTRLAAVNYDLGTIYTSANGGSSWILASAPNEFWQFITSSSDGNDLMAGVSGGGLYNSADGGATWTMSSAPGESWNCAASSQDGSRLVAGIYGGGIYTSVGAVTNLAPGTTYHYRAVGVNINGTSYGNDLTFTTLSVSSAVNFGLSHAVRLPDGAFQFSFTNLDSLSFTVLTATNLELPLANWTVLGTATEAPPGQYQFTDPQTTNSATRFYRVRSP